MKCWLMLTMCLSLYVFTICVYHSHLGWCKFSWLLGIGYMEWCFCICLDVQSYTADYIIVCLYCGLFLLVYQESWHDLGWLAMWTLLIPFLSLCGLQICLDLPNRIAILENSHLRIFGIWVAFLPIAGPPTCIYCIYCTYILVLNLFQVYVWIVGLNF